MGNIKKLLVAAMGSAVMLTAAAASAITVVPNYGPLTFSGPVTLTYLGVPISCTLELVGIVGTFDAGVINIDVVEGTVIPGSSLCSQISLELPWKSTIHESDFTTNPNAVVSFTFTDVRVTAFGASCGSSSGNSVVVNYQYVNPANPPSVISASFSLSGNVGMCGVSGVLNETTGTLIVTNP